MLRLLELWLGSACDTSVTYVPMEVLMRCFDYILLHNSISEIFMNICIFFLILQEAATSARLTPVLRLWLARTSYTLNPGARQSALYMLCDSFNYYYDFM